MGGTSRARRRDAAWNPPSKGGDVTALFAATRVGYSAAGPSGGLIAFGMGCFLLVPFVPQRLR